MANYCYNSVEITDFDKQDFHRILTFFEKYERYDYFSEWGDSLGVDANSDDDVAFYDVMSFYKYGTRWWDFSVETSGEDTILVIGDSAWSPPAELCRCISKAFNCRVTIEYSEPGMDFAGESEYFEGVKVNSYECSYNEFDYKINPDGHLEYLQDWIVEGHENEEELLDTISHLSEPHKKEMIEYFNKIK